jgi:Repeat of unknown function (DUF5907)
MRTTVIRTLGVALGVVAAGSIMAATSGITTRQARTAAPAAVTAGASSAEGSSLAFARADHVHPASGFAPATTGTVLLKGDGSGGFSAFAGTGSRPASSWLAGLSASGAPTWAQIDWTDVQSKPTTFPPEPHSQSWSTITERPTNFTPPAADADTTGGIRLAGDLTGVFTAPEVVDNSHSHTGLTVTNVTVPWSLVTERPTNFTPPAADIDTMGGIRLTGDLSGGFTSPQVVDDSHSHTSVTIASASYAGSAGYATSAGNADTLDGSHASAFAVSGHTHTGSTVSDLDAADVTTGTFAPARLGTYDLAAFLPNKPQQNVVLARLALTRATRLPAGLTGSIFFAETPANAVTVITIRKRTAGGTTTNIGTLTFAASANSATVSFASYVDFAAGDFLEYYGPVATNATLEDLSLTISAARL